MCVCIPLSRKPSHRFLMAALESAAVVFGANYVKMRRPDVDPRGPHNHVAREKFPSRSITFHRQMFSFSSKRWC